MRRLIVLLLLLAVVGFVGLQWLQTLNPAAIPPTILKVIITPTTVTVNGPQILDSIRNEAKLETVAMAIAGDQTLQRTWGFQGACTENVTYLGYYNVTAGVDLQTLSASDIQVENIPGSNQPAITIKMPPADILHVELDTQRSRVVHDDISLISQLCGTEMAQMVTEAQANIQTMAEASAVQKGILNQAQDRANFEMQRLLMALGFTNVKFQNPPPIDPG